MTRWTIYCHTHIDSGRRYIGLTRLTMMKRWNTHVYNAMKEVKGWGHFPNAIRKYGKDAFTHEMLQTYDSLEQANEAERFAIWFFCTQDPEFGFNHAPGGDHLPHPISNPWERPGYREVISQKIGKWSKSAWQDHKYVKNVIAGRKHITSEQRKQYRAAWLAKNPGKYKEKHGEYMKKYRAENKEKHGEYMKKYRAENKEKIKQSRKEYYWTNKDRQ